MERPERATRREPAGGTMRVVVVAGGKPVADDARHLDGAGMVIAADGGAGWLHGLGCPPDLLVGDLDSTGPELLAALERAGTRIERHPVQKDASDAELALGRATAAGDEVVLLGAMGGRRLDHELANLLLIADPRWRGRVRDLRIVRGDTLVRAVHGGDRLGLEAPVGALVTLLAVGGDAEGVLTDGLRYPLHGERLAFGGSRGLSNVVARAPASVSLERGTLLVVEQLTEGVEP
ncbi:MAG TPA: thiamine diphosphokinase [candidate division Zixibacteria bacterium]|nr:thiamine diphosphokinase [candidate division Zixibacteria bacterium]